ncbi:MAG TPA: hypothetical protein VNA25_13230 [Phycisphaerae bacterium]|nr:hypothetical protein [Phycisphaerae bacterium]
MNEERLAMLERRVAALEWEKSRTRTWAEVIHELESIVVDVQVSDLSNALRKLAQEQRDE